MKAAFFHPTQNLQYQNRLAFPASFSSSLEHLTQMTSVPKEKLRLLCSMTLTFLLCLRETPSPWPDPHHPIHTLTIIRASDQSLSEGASLNVCLKAYVCVRLSQTGQLKKTKG